MSRRQKSEGFSVKVNVIEDFSGVVKKHLAWQCCDSITCALEQIFNARTEDSIFSVKYFRLKSNGIEKKQNYNGENIAHV